MRGFIVILRRRWMIPLFFTSFFFAFCKSFSRIFFWYWVVFRKIQNYLLNVLFSNISVWELNQKLLKMEAGRPNRGESSRSLVVSTLMFGWFNIVSSVLFLFAIIIAAVCLFPCLLFFDLSFGGNVLLKGKLNCYIDCHGMLMQMLDWILRVFTLGLQNCSSVWCL